MKKIGLCLMIFLLTSCTNSMATQDIKQDKPNNYAEAIRKAAVVGQFYPADEKLLEHNINKYLSGINLVISNKNNPKAILVPHAGYEFSGPVAAHAYSLLRDREFKTVVIICNSHTGYFDGIAIDNNDYWETPLGQVAVDKELAYELSKNDESINFNSEAHAQEHTLEVQLPFLQTTLKPGFKIVPVLFGNSDSEAYKKLSKALTANLEKDDLIVVSTDLSHYPHYDDANLIDKKTLDLIAAGDIDDLNNHILDIEEKSYPNEQTMCCGIDGVKTLMNLMQKMNWEGQVLNYANSGDRPEGDKNQVVGYGAVAFWASENKKSQVADELSKAQQAELLQIARNTVEMYIKEGKIPQYNIQDQRLSRQEGAFVTIHKGDNLRGCIGQIIPSDKPLWQVVQEMAISAATEDYRFDPINRNELAEIDYEVSVLSRPQKIKKWQDIELGKHGVIVKKDYRSGVFLPQVATETGWDLDEFLEQLCAQKAGLPASCYKDESVDLEVFTAQVFSEK